MIQYILAMTTPWIAARATRTGRSPGLRVEAFRDAAFPDGSSGCSLLQEPASRARRLQLQGQLGIFTPFPFQAPKGTGAIDRRWS